jgi:uncharacterized protein (DUF433 family)
MRSALPKFLDAGLYTVAEAAMYTRVPTSLMSRWIFGSKAGEAVIEQQIGNDEKLVSFLDLVQTLAIREIRTQHNVPLQKFREAIQVAKRNLKMTYPFARKHCTYWSGQELIIRERPGEKEFVEASGKHRGQRLFSFIERYLDDLTYDTAGLAREYVIYRSPDKVEIKMSPERRFGEPLLPSGYTPHAIWEAVTIEGGFPQAAKAYGIDREQVKAAYDFVNGYLGRSAA